MVVRMIVGGPMRTVWTGKIVYRMFGEMVYSFMIK